MKMVTMIMITVESVINRNRLQIQLQIQYIYEHGDYEYDYAWKCNHLPLGVARYLKSRCDNMYRDTWVTIRYVSRYVSRQKAWFWPAIVF